MTLARAAVVRFAVVMGWLSALGVVAPAEAHILGEDSVDQYVRATPAPEGTLVDFYVHFAELPTESVQISRRVDADHDGLITESERHAWAQRWLDDYAQYIHVRVGGVPVPVQWRPLPDLPPTSAFEHEWLTGSGATPTLRIHLRLIAPWPEDAAPDPEHAVRVDIETTYRPQVGTCRVALGPAWPGVSVHATDLPNIWEVPLPSWVETPADAPEEIPRQYGGYVDVVSDPNADVGMRPVEPETATTSVAQREGVREDHSYSTWIQRHVLAALQPPLSAGTWMLALSLCVVWGAAHALTPGHGKAIVGTYLISSRGTMKQAVFLGLAVTISHTFVVLLVALAAAVFWPGSWSVPTWLGVLSGGIVVVVGVMQTMRGVRAMILRQPIGHHHHHDHDHAHHHQGHEHGPSHGHGHHHHIPLDAEGRARWGELLGLGISGGIVPCPAAIVMLLASWRLGAPVLGLVCLVVFGLGLAATLTGLGCLAVAGAGFVRRWVQREDRPSRLVGLVPTLGGIALILFGLLLVFLDPVR